VFVDIGVDVRIRSGAERALPIAQAGHADLEERDERVLGSSLIQGADHAFDNNALDTVEVMAASIDLFLDRLLINPRPYPSFGGGGGGRGGRGGRGAAPGGRGQ